VFPGWKFQPADFVAAFGLHAGLVVGPPRTVRPEDIADLAAQLPGFTIRLSRDGQLVEEGSGKNSLRSPALCLGELISSGTLTESRPITPGETWTAAADGLDVAGLALTLSA
jgi:2-keto-4-pentenoate hydratase